jgi:hypothetical protein
VTLKLLMLLGLEVEPKEGTEERVSVEGALETVVLVCSTIHAGLATLNLPRVPI